MYRMIKKSIFIYKCNFKDKCVYKQHIEMIKKSYFSF